MTLLRKVRNKFVIPEPLDSVIDPRGEVSASLINVLRELDNAAEVEWSTLVVRIGPDDFDADKTSITAVAYGEER